RQSQIDPGTDPRRIELRRVLQIGDRLVETAESTQRLAAVDEESRTGTARQRDAALEQWQRLLRSALEQFDGAEADERPTRLRVERQRLVELTARRRVVAEVEE